MASSLTHAERDYIAEILCTAQPPAKSSLSAPRAFADTDTIWRDLTTMKLRIDGLAQELAQSVLLDKSPVLTELRAALMKVEMNVQQISGEWIKFNPIDLQHRVERLEANQNSPLELIRDSLLSEVRRAVHSEITAALGADQGPASGTETTSISQCGEARLEDDGLQTGKAGPRLSQIARSVNDQYQFNSSIWDAAIFVCLPQLGAGATFFVLLSLALLICMLIVFVGIIVENFISPNSFGPATQEAFRAWRSEYAHRQSLADHMTGTSLASRVCNQDLSLVTSAYQFSVVSDLLAYLPDFEACTTFSCEITQMLFTGPMLVLLSVVVWFLTVAAQSHSIGLLGRALIQLPQATTTCLVNDGEHVELQAISASRKAFGLFIVFVRLAFNATLFATGSFFQIHSVNLQNILLNALALEFVLHLDELLYASLGPLQVRGLLDNLKPLQLESWHRIAGADAFTSTVPFLLVMYVFVVYFFILSPFVDEMIASENILCGGNLDWVTVPDAAGVMWATRTPAYGASALTLSQYAADSVKKTIQSWSKAVADGAIRIYEPSGIHKRGENFNMLRHAIKQPSFFYAGEYNVLVQVPSNPFVTYTLRQLLQNQTATCSDVISIRSVPSCYQNYQPGGNPWYGPQSDAIIRIQALCQNECGCYDPWHGTIFKTHGGCRGVSNSLSFQADLAYVPCEDPSIHLNATIIVLINTTVHQNPEITRLGLAWPDPSTPAFCALAYNWFHRVDTVWTTFCPATWGCKYSNLSNANERFYCPSSCPCNALGCTALNI